MSNNTWRTTGKILKYLCVIFVFSVCGLLLWRIFSSGDPRSMKTLMVSQATYDAYQNSGESLEIYYQEQLSLTRAEHNPGYFGVSQVAIIPEANQIQLVFRYNNSTLASVAEDLGLPEDKIPSRDEDVFDVSILVSTDLTPEDKTDNAYNAAEYPEAVSEKRYFPSEVITEKKNVYNYRKYIFENISLDELTLAVYVDVFYCGYDANGEKVTPSYVPNTPGSGSLCIYDYKSEKLFRKLTKDDIEALERFGKE